jgi:phosphatidylserine/phosphatidylglycerophosphate/cardiolipin synthase-like enzyme
MCRTISWFLALFIVLSLVSSTHAQKYEVHRAAAFPSYEVYFSPHGGATEAVVRHIQAARRSLRILAYSFTSKPIVAAVIEAHSRGVDVQVVLDRSQSHGVGGVASELLEAKVPTRIDASHPIAHNKVIIYDGQLVSQGSFNFTKQAEANGENILFTPGAELAQIYLENWAKHWEHAQLLTRQMLFREREILQGEDWEE